MDHGLMMGMLIGGLLLSAVPLALGTALCVAGIRIYREEREREMEELRRRRSAGRGRGSASLPWESEETGEVP
jgi:hypothetical protein